VRRRRLLGDTYRLRRMVTASLPHVRVAWSPETVVMVPSIRTVEVDGWAAGAKAWRCEGRMRGVVIEVILSTSVVPGDNLMSACEQSELVVEIERRRFGCFQWWIFAVNLHEAEDAHGRRDEGHLESSFGVILSPPVPPPCHRLCCRLSPDLSEASRSLVVVIDGPRIQRY
jgi:hypothetical protein